jgi:hypothetical protein
MIEDEVLCAQMDKGIEEQENHRWQIYAIAV